MTAPPGPPGPGPAAGRGGHCDLHDRHKTFGPHPPRSDSEGTAFKAVFGFQDFARVTVSQYTRFWNSPGGALTWPGGPARAPGPGRRRCLDRAGHPIIYY